MLVRYLTKDMHVKQPLYTDRGTRARIVTLYMHKICMPRWRLLIWNACTDIKSGYDKAGRMGRAERQQLTIRYSMLSSRINLSGNSVRYYWYRQLVGTYRAISRLKLSRRPDRCIY